MLIPLILVAVGLGLFAFGVLFAIRRRNMHIWLPHYIVAGDAAGDERLPTENEVEVLIAVCDHFEPEWGRPSLEESRRRVNRWVTEYPRLMDGLADSDGRPPQHTFFFPQDEYQPEYLDALAELVADGWGDVDIHLHHDNDTPEGFREKMAGFRDTLAERHGLLRVDPQTGRIAYGFIHGNWALCNSRPDGRWCGVDHEIPILLDTGCYADFTMPSAPSNTQTRTVNRIYYATDQPGCKSHDRGQLASVGHSPSPDELLMIQGPLVPDWGRRKFGLLPRIENGDLHAGRPADLRRFRMWMNAHVHVVGAAERVFVKLHTHGCKDGNIDTLLGPETRRFHESLAEYAAEHPGFRYRYVTAWEMANAVRELESDSLAPTDSTRQLELIR